jgi:bacterioferritin-associated ferredoxin
MYLRATCDECGDTAREVLARENAAIPAEVG